MSQAHISQGGDTWAGMRLLDSAPPVESHWIDFRRGAHMTSRVATALGFIVAVMGLAVVGLVALPFTAGAERGIRVGQAAPEITGGPWVNSACLPGHGGRHQNAPGRAMRDRPA
jgi:hypothetical protein